MNIILGITGSVATVLAPKLAMGLMDSGHTVKIIATNPALYFLPPEQFNSEDLSINYPGSTYVNVYIDKHEWPIGGYHKKDPVKHIEFRDWADLFLIAPLSANTLAKIANGIADNFLSCVARAWPKEKPFVIAPAMNTEMWIDKITGQQIYSLSYRYKKMTMINPIEKKLACGDIGIGAMAEIDTILETINKIDLKN